MAAPVLAVEFPGPMPAPLPAVVVPPTAPSIAQTPAIDIDIDIDVDAEPEPFVVPPTPAPAPPASPSRMVPKPSTPVGSYFGAGTYMMVKPERAHDAPGVKIPPDAEDPAQALRLALAGRN